MSPSEKIIQAEKLFEEGKNKKEIRWKKWGKGSSYFVSDDARILSIRFLKKTDDYKICLIKQTPKPNGYLKVSICINGKIKTMFVHRLVATLFCKQKNANSNEVNHKNGNKLDNRAENLEWVTRSENLKHAVDILGVKSAKLTSKKAREIEKLFREGKNMKQISKIYNVTPQAIKLILNGTTWVRSKNV